MSVTFCCHFDFSFLFFMILGLDLAAKEYNPTGVCFLKSNIALLQFAISDDEILQKIRQNTLELIAIDAPLSFENRVCDKQLKYLGAMPLNLPSISQLAQRAKNITNKIKNINIIEVFPTGTAKILRIYSKNISEYKRNLQSLINSELPKKVNKHLIDAFLSALTGLLYLNKLTLSVGEQESFIIIPNPNDYTIIVDFIKKLNIKIELAKEWSF